MVLLSYKCFFGRLKNGKHRFVAKLPSGKQGKLTKIELRGRSSDGLNVFVQRIAGCNGEGIWSMSSVLELNCFKWKSQCDWNVTGFMALYII